MARKVGRESMPTWTATTCELWGLVIRGRERGKTKSNPNAEKRHCGMFPSTTTEHLIPSLGFTLLELSLVMFIIGLLLTIVVPRLGDLSGTRLESSARRLAALARYLNGEAAFKSQLYRLNYDLDKRAYWVSSLTANQN